MDSEQIASIESRLSELESEFARLRRHLLGEATPKIEPKPELAGRPAPELVFKKVISVSVETPPWRTSEYWLGRVGIGLSVLAVVFLFDYAVDQGWLTPWTRVSLGLTAGAGLAVWGVLIRGTHRHLSTLLQCGALVAFYICGFAAYEMYELISWQAALIWMSAATAVGLGRAFFSRDATLSLVAAAGGLATPSMIYNLVGSATALMIYLAPLLIILLALFWLRGWRSLYWVSAAGGWMVLSQGVKMVHGYRPTEPDFISVLLVVLLLGWLGMWLVLLFRELAEQRGKLAKPGVENFPEWFREAAGWLQDVTIRPAVPALGFAAVASVWSLILATTNQMGWVVMGLAAALASSYFLLRWLNHMRLAGIHGSVAVSALTVAVCLFFRGEALLAVLAAECLLVHLAASRLKDNAILVPAHILVVLTLGMLVNNMAVGYHARDMIRIINPDSLALLAVLAMLALVSFLIENAEPLPAAYRTAAHTGLLVWLAFELGPLPGGEGWVSSAWGLYGLLLIVPGLVTGNSALRISGLATLFLTAGKLLIVDLSRVDPLWRILLFMVFGAVFLVLGYRLRHLWRPAKKQSQKNK